VVGRERKVGHYAWRREFVGDLAEVPLENRKIILIYFMHSDFD